MLVSLNAAFLYDPDRQLEFLGTTASSLAALPSVGSWVALPDGFYEVVERNFLYIDPLMTVTLLVDDNHAQLYDDLTTSRGGLFAVPALQQKPLGGSASWTLKPGTTGCSGEAHRQTHRIPRVRQHAVQKDLLR